MLGYGTIIICVLAVRAIIESISVNDTTSVVNAIDGIIASVLRITLWLNRKRAGNKFAICMLLLILVGNIQRLISTYLQLKFSPELDDVQKTIILKRNLEFLK